MNNSALRIFNTTEISPEEINRRLLPPAADIAAVQQIVDDIVQRVRDEGDAAVLELTRKFDWPEATLAGLKVGEEEIERALAEVDAATLDSMKQAADHIRRYHQRQMPQDWFDEAENGLLLGQRHSPVDSVACYVPTRKASIPSSLLMSVVPAQVAGVPRIVVVGPCRADGSLPSGVLAAAGLLGIREMYKLGGAVAMAAMAFGTATFPKVDKVVGPANIFGTLAKKSLYGEVGVDGLYGPSEVAIVADGSVPAEWIAIDLLSQSEHGEDSQSVLITPDAAYAQAVNAAVASLLLESPRAKYLSVSLEQRGAIILTRDLAEAAEMANLLAAEHLELAVADPQALLPAIRHAGSILLGGCSTVPIGDYFAGPSHILPTGRTARFSSGLGVMDFLKRSSLIQVDCDWLAKHQEAITTLADHEGLDAHGAAIRKRV
ncbi:MAG TPA: histidinol dehydrogenase [Armatimonadota bacterium]|jgi:histidinol dehydrogenase